MRIIVVDMVFAPCDKGSTATHSQGRQKMIEAPITTAGEARAHAAIKTLEYQLNRANLRNIALTEEIEKLHDEIDTMKANVLEAINVDR